MSYSNGIPDNNAANAPYKFKTGLVSDENLIDTALPNDWQQWTDNPDADGKLPFLIAADGDGVTQLNNPNGVNAYALSTVQLSTPATPTITNAGTAGSTANAYKIVAWNGQGVTLGHTAASSAGSTATANATLSTSNYNVVTFAPVTGAAYYTVFRTTAAGTPSTTGEIGTVPATIDTTTGAQPTSYTFNDTGIAADSTTAPTTNTTGAVSFPVLGGSITVPVLDTPSGLAVTVNGTAGSTAVGYKVVALASVGTSAASSEATTATANATMSSSNSLTVTWDPVSGAVGYQIYRTTAAGTPSSTGSIGTTDAETFTFTDTGIAGDSSTPPTTNSTGAIALARITDTSENAELIFSATSSAVNQFTMANGATGSGPTLTATGTDTNIPATLAGKGTGSVILGQATSAGVRLAADQPIADSSGNAFISFTKTASAVSSLGVVNAATGNGTTNPVVVAPISTDAAVGLTITPKAAAGVLTLGLSTGTADVVVGSSSATQIVKVGNGAGISTVDLANVSVAGANVNMASAVTGAGITDTVTISGGNAAATGIKVVNIATGTPGTSGNNRVTIGGGATSKVTLKAVATATQALNYVTAGGSNNAITIALTDAGSANIAEAAGLELTVNTGALTLQSGANTLALNGGSAAAIKKGSNPATDITAIAAGGIIKLVFDGTAYLLMGQ